MKQVIAVVRPEKLNDVLEKAYRIRTGEEDQSAVTPLPRPRDGRGSGGAT